MQCGADLPCEGPRESQYLHRLFVRAYRHAYQAWPDIHVCLQVYKARWHGDLVAVKVIFSRDPTELGNFKREGDILKELRYRHVVSYLRSGHRR